MKKKIAIDVTLDEKNVPLEILWDADDAANAGLTACRALILALWDHKKKDTLRLDLWTKDMTVDEMKLFFHETLLTMADTLERSTSEDKMAGDMRDFCDYFAEKMDISPRKPESF